MAEEQVGGLLVRSDADRPVFKAPAPRTSLLGEQQVNDSYTCSPHAAGLYFYNDS